MKCVVKIASGTQEHATASNDCVMREGVCKTKNAGKSAQGRQHRLGIRLGDIEMIG